nr:MAG TPA: hypothetical protein [Caudoviricetes sp.]
MSKQAFLIVNIEEYGKLISFCINNDICVFRTYWDEREKGDRCYNIDWKEKRCYYSSRRYYENNGYEIVSPTFQLNEYGKYNAITQLMRYCI